MHLKGPNAKLVLALTGYTRIKLAAMLAVIFYGQKNTFFSLGLQRDIHILQAGLRADSTLDGQLGFHRDFLRVARNLNNRFIKTFKNQLALINNH